MLCCNRAQLVTNAKRKNSLRGDPTRTIMIRRRFIADMTRRFRRVRKAVYHFLVTVDALGLQEKKNPVLNAQPREFQFSTDAGKLKAFNDWLLQQIQADILSVPPGGNAAVPWTSPYLTSSYKMGQINAYLAAKQGLASTDPGFVSQSQAQFFRDSFNNPETTSKIQLLATRAFENLKGVTSTMSSQLNQILAQGMLDGSGAEAIANEMTDKIDSLSDSRALTIARTEVINAHAEGQLDAFVDLGVEELGVKAEWSTAGDDRVCPECEELEGNIYTIDEARGMIPVHPNCRCAWIPYVPDKDTKA